MPSSTSSSSSSSSSGSDSSSDSSSEADEDRNDVNTINQIATTNAKLEKARSNANRSLPPPLEKYTDVNEYTTILLMYQYVEPRWSKKEHKLARKTVTQLAEKYNVTGRGRCAPEGLNCTLTAGAKDIRLFCDALREWNPIFKETDFKFTDGVPIAKKFKSLSMRKVDELVAYLLEGEAAPSLTHSAGTHLEADKYHQMLQQPDTVVIDVRNAYESAIGHFQPPPTGATLIDPKMRNSKDFAPWLNMPETKKKLNGKKVMMYCTGGIRCERATALLNDMTAVDSSFKTQGVFELRGGVDRYLKTFPEGGLWKGKNYVFDRRLVQVPENKPIEKLDADIESKCVVCRKLWDEYRGKYKCSVRDCGVPVIVCSDCVQSVETPLNIKSLQCELCRENYKAPRARPNLKNIKKQVLQKRKQDRAASSTSSFDAKKRKKGGNFDDSTTRIFVGKMPFVVSATELKLVLSPNDPNKIEIIDWKKDHKTGLFYGSAFVKFKSSIDAENVTVAATEQPLVLKGKKLKINLAPLREGEVWPRKDHVDVERPPIC